MMIIAIICSFVVGAALALLVVRKVATSKIDKFISGIQNYQGTIARFMERYFAPDEFRLFVSNLKENLSQKIYARLSDKSFGDDVSHVTLGYVQDKLSGNREETQQDNQGFLKSTFRAIKNAVKGGAETILEANRGSIEERLSEKINEVISADGYAIVSNIVDKEVDKILSMPVAKLFEGNEQLITSLRQKVHKAF